MSAFMVSSETMQRVVHACLTYKAFPFCNTAADGDKLGARLFEMNRDALNARYGAHADHEPEPFTYRPLGDIPVVHMIKALDCFTYQCSEGDVDRRPEFATLECLITKLCREIVRQSPDYDRAPWDSGWPEPARTNPAAPRTTDIIKAQGAEKWAGKPDPVMPPIPSDKRKPDLLAQFRPRPADDDLDSDEVF